MGIIELQVDFGKDTIETTRGCLTLQSLLDASKLGSGAAYGGWDGFAG